MKVTLVRDEWLLLTPTESRDCGRQVNVLPQTVRRWRRLIKAVDEVQAEFQEAYTKALRESLR